MIVKLLSEHHLEFLSLKGSCRGPSESTHFKMPHCWKSHATAQIFILGTVPGPVIFGAVTDTACLVWQTECGENSSCWIYDNFAISRNYFLIAMSVKCLSIVFFSIAFCTYKPPIGAEEKYSNKAYTNKDNGQMNFGFNEDTDKNLKNTDDVKNVSHTISEEEAESITTTRI